MSCNRHNCLDYPKLQYMLPFAVKPLFRPRKWSLSSFLCDRQGTLASLHSRDSPRNLFCRPLKTADINAFPDKKEYLQSTYRLVIVQWPFTSAPADVGHMYKQPKLQSVCQGREMDADSLSFNSAINTIKCQRQWLWWAGRYKPKLSVHLRDEMRLWQHLFMRHLHEALYTMLV